jgi:hypothetical protein
MLLERLRAPNRCPGAIRIFNAVAANFALAFDKPSRDGSGKATIRSRAGSVVHGVVFQIPLNQLEALNAAEGAGKGYEPVQGFAISTKSGPLTALTYIADSQSHGLRPYDWYLELVIAGAEQNGLPEKYIDSLKGVGFVPDQQPNRATRLEALQALADANLA